MAAACAQGSLWQFEKVVTFSDVATHHHSCSLDINAETSRVCHALGMHGTITMELAAGDDHWRCWSIQMSRSSKRKTLGKGWKKFVIDNRVAVGDTLRFTVLSRTQLAVEIVHKGNEVAVINPATDDESGVSKGKKRICVGRHDKPEKKRMDAGRRDKPENKRSLEGTPKQATMSLRWSKPFFWFTARNDSNTTLNIPETLTEALPNETYEASLECDCGRTWNAQSVRCNSDPLSLLNRVWKAFMLDHGLQEGDTCILKLLESDMLQVHVYVYKPGMGKPYCPVAT